MRTRFTPIICTAVGITLGPIVAAADPSEVVSLEVLPGWRMEDGTHIAALKIDLAPGWKTYWRAPGDAGIPPVIDWSGSRNLKSMMPAWPTPQVFSQNGMNSVGYEDDLVLPVVLAPQNPGAKISLKGEMQIGICSDICVPAELRFDVALPPTLGEDRQIRDALESQPVPAKLAGVGQVSCHLSLTDDGLSLRANITMPPAGHHEYAVVETLDPEVWVAESVTQRSGDTLTVTTELVHMEGGTFALDRSGLRVTVLGSNRAVDIKGCPAD